ncbi:MAG: DNA translocase FtsK [Patescibacteria group bacterium]|nr:DNA translocase FtsK [Patescibacteria group bacterium]
MAQKIKKSQRSESHSADPAGPSEPSLDPETQREIGVIVLFAFGVLFILSLFGFAGSIGKFINDALRYIFGWVRYLIPLILLGWGYMLMRPKRFFLKTNNYVGLAIFVISASAIFHLFIPFDEATSAISDGRGGGYAGFFLSYPFQKIMGFWASLVAILAICLISVLILFNTTLSRLAQKPTKLGRALQSLTSFFGLFRKRAAPPEEEYAPEEFEPDKTPETQHEFKQSTLTESAPDVKSTQPKTETSARRRKVDLPLDLLDSKSAKPMSGDTAGNAEKIRKTLENFGLQVEMGDIKIGPTVTQYTLRPAEGVKLSQITGLSNDLALALAAHPIRIEAPIPGKSLVGVEVPNQQVATVRLRDILESSEFKKRSGNLIISLGRDVAGNVALANLEAMPHLLIAGATGSGKSVAIHSLIVSLLYQNGPDEVKFILVDPKKVELNSYANIPHLLTPVITEVDKTINALKWCITEMDRRYHLLAEANKKNITVYNSSVLLNKLPYIIVIIDELADLMSAAAQDVEGAIIRLAQMARAVGIHLVVSTQRPSVDVITGLIKANITSRMAFSVASQMDSRTILDYAGAEKLLGRGDMLYVSSELSKPKRVQGALVTESELDRVADYLRRGSGPEYLETVTEKQATASSNGLENLGDDELLASAKEVVWQANKASASLLQRRLRIGYARAARLLDLLEEEGIIGPGEGAKPRDILRRQPEDSPSASEPEEREEE